MGRVDDVIEVDVQLLRRDHVHGPLQIAEGDALWPHDTAEGDDLLLGVGDVAHDLVGLALEDVVGSGHAFARELSGEDAAARALRPGHALPH